MAAHGIFADVFMYGWRVGGSSGSLLFPMPEPFDYGML